MAWLNQTYQEIVLPLQPPTANNAADMMAKGMHADGARAAAQLFRIAIVTKGLTAAGDPDYDQMVKCIAKWEVQAERAEVAIMRSGGIVEDRLQQDRDGVAALWAPIRQTAELIQTLELMANQLTHDQNEVYRVITAIMVNARVIAELIVETYNHGPIPTTDEVAAAAMRQLTNLVKALGRKMQSSAHLYQSTQYSRSTLLLCSSW
jgi:hypothetical protein